MARCSAVDKKVGVVAMHVVSTTTTEKNGALIIFDFAPYFERWWCFGKRVLILPKLRRIVDLELVSVLLYRIKMFIFLMRHFFCPRQIHGKCTVVRHFAGWKLEAYKNDGWY